MPATNRDVFELEDRSGFYARVRVVAADGQVRTRRRKMGDSLAKARAALRNWIEAEEGGVGKVRNGRSLTWLTEKYLEAINPRRESKLAEITKSEIRNPTDNEWRANKVQFKTWQAYRRTCSDLCTFLDHDTGEPLGLFDPAEIKPFHITQWLLENAERWGQSSERAKVKHLKALFHWGVRMDYLDKDPLLNVQVSPSVVRTRLVTPAEYERLLAAADPALADMMRVLKGTGCRPDEARRLTAADFDAELKCAVLAKHKSSYKTRKPRHIFLPDSLRPLLRTLIAARPTGELLRDPAGSPWTAPGLSKSFAELRARLELDRSLVLYSLRHTWITDAILRGEQIEIIARLAGHSSSKVTSEVYAHVLDPNHKKSMQAAVERISQRSR